MLLVTAPLARMAAASPIVGNRRFWACWMNAKQAIAYLDIPAGRFWWLIREGWLPAATTGPSDRKLWFPADLRRSYARMPERFKQTAPAL